MVASYKVGDSVNRWESLWVTEEKEERFAGSGDGHSTVVWTAGRWNEVRADELADRSWRMGAEVECRACWHVARPEFGGMRACDSVNNETRGTFAMPVGASRLLYGRLGVSHGDLEWTTAGGSSTTCTAAGWAALSVTALAGLVTTGMLFAHLSSLGSRVGLRVRVATYLQDSRRPMTLMRSGRVHVRRECDVQYPQRRVWTLELGDWKLCAKLVARGVL